MVINSATFISDIVLFVREKLRTDLTDPLSSRTGKFIMTSYPKRVTEYPIITVKVTSIDTIKLGMQSELTWTTVDLEIRVWAKNAKQSDTLTANVINSLRQAQFGVDSTTDEEMFGFNLSSTVPVVEELNDTTIHSKVMTFTYKNILN